VISGICLEIIVISGTTTKRIRSCVRTAVHSHLQVAWVQFSLPRWPCLDNFTAVLVPVFDSTVHCHALRWNFLTHQNWLLPASGTCGALRGVGASTQ
jgi:hypothetical protein